MLERDWAHIDVCGVRRYNYVVMAVTNLGITTVLVHFLYTTLYPWIRRRCKRAYLWRRSQALGAIRSAYLLRVASCISVRSAVSSAPQQFSAPQLFQLPAPQP